MEEYISEVRIKKPQVLQDYEKDNLLILDTKTEANIHMMMFLSNISLTSVSILGFYRDRNVLLLIVSLIGISFACLVEKLLLGYIHKHDLIVTGNYNYAVEFLEKEKKRELDRQEMVNEYMNSGTIDPNKLINRTVHDKK